MAVHLQRTEDIKIAILPIGYADGYLRSMQGAFVNVKGHQCEVIGQYVWIK